MGYALCNMARSSFVNPLLLVLAVGCGSFSSTDVSPPGSGPDGGGGADAGGGVGAGGDAGADAPPGLQPGSGRWCDRQPVKHTFCADFDDPKVELSRIFDQVRGNDSVGENSITIDRANGVDGTGSLLFTVDKNPPSLQLLADVNLVPAPKGFSCSFDMKFETPAPSYLGTLVWVTSGALEIALGAELSFKGGTGSSQSDDFELPGMSWKRVTLDVDVASSRASAKVNDVELAEITSLGLGAAFAPTVHLGTIYPNGNAFAFRYDNIVCDVK